MTRNLIIFALLAITAYNIYDIYFVTKDSVDAQKEREEKKIDKQLYQNAYRICSDTQDSFSCDGASTQEIVECIKLKLSVDPRCQEALEKVP